MAFENINVDALKNALHACESSISYNNSLEIISSISSGNVWKTESCNHLKKALTTLTNDRYSELKKQINSYLSVANLIVEYQQLAKENKQMESELPTLRKKLYYTSRYYVTRYDKEGEPYKEWKTETKTDYNIQRQIKSYENKISENSSKMQKLETQVSNSI